MSEDFPTRGFAIVQPTIVESQLTGWLGTAQFTRGGYEYAIRFQEHRIPGCLRDNKPVHWGDLPKNALAVAEKAADFLNAAAKLAR